MTIPVLNEYACFLAKRFAQHFSFSSESYQAIRRERERQMLDKYRRQKHAYSLITGIYNKRIDRLTSSYGIIVSEKSKHLFWLLSWQNLKAKGEKTIGIININNGFYCKNINRPFASYQDKLTSKIAYQNSNNCFYQIRNVLLYFDVNRFEEK